jgi:hypothetical protein
MADPDGRDPATPAADPGAAQPTVENRWWVDGNTSAKRRGPTPPSERETPPIVGERMFGVGRGFDQDRAKVRLTESNLNLLREGNPPEDGWAYLQMTEQRSSNELVDRVKRAVRLPRGSRGVLVDSGASLRVIVTGQPFGERVVEITLGGDSALDGWTRGEWTIERVFRSRERALREAPHVLARYLRQGD